MPESRNKDLESKLVEQVYEQLCAPVKTRDDLLRLFVHTLAYTASNSSAVVFKFEARLNK